ncbi:rod shape-determining protein MreD [Altererythrobacter soli]|uniref:Rod shape-determining protein MreD n=1 Tax=Croceibacterium soli TaxID=1739690 RepID=A0A6I4UPI7_9SPHN|nr:rod shape-determining protein MreD [Croceibacterium soli]MXP40692.1 rod shape-determining protein MreD [Croceibacterium soli]
MIDQINPRARRDAFGTKINRDHSRLLAYGVPWLAILLFSLTPMLPVIASAPVMPPLGYMFMLAWRLMRPGLLPMWAGLPLGAFDDLFSGQPFGGGILLFSLTLIAADFLDARFPWRSFWQDWMIASLVIAIYIGCAALVSGADLETPLLVALVPQLLLSVLAFPIIARMVSLLDRLRLLRIRRLG